MVEQEGQKTKQQKKKHPDSSPISYKAWSYAW